MLPIWGSTPEIRLIDPDDIAGMFMMTTHNMPLNYLVDQIKDDVGEVLFLGIQPDIVGFYYPMTPPVKEAVEVVYSRLEGWVGDGGFLRSEQCRVAASPYPAYQTVPSPVGESRGEGNRLLEIAPVTRNHLLIPPERFLALPVQRAVPRIVAVNVHEPVAFAHFAGRR